MALRKTKAHERRTPLPDRRGLRGDHALAPRARRSPRLWRRPVAATATAARRRVTAAAATSASTGSSTSAATKTACPRRLPAIEYDPNRNARIALAPLPRRREAVHPGSGPGEGRRRSPERSGLRDQARQRPAASLHPGRLHGAQHRAASRRRRQARPRRRHERAAGREGRSLRHACASRPPRCAVSPSTAAAPSARSATPRPSSSRSERPAVTAGRGSALRPAASP